MGNFKAVFSSWDNSEAKHTEEFWAGGEHVHSNILSCYKLWDDSVNHCVCATLLPFLYLFLMQADFATVR